MWAEVSNTAEESLRDRCEVAFGPVTRLGGFSRLTGLWTRFSTEDGVASYVLDPPKQVNA